MEHSKSQDTRYDIVQLQDQGADAAEAAQRRAAVLKTHSLLAEWRSRFADEVVDPKENREGTLRLGSASATDAVAEAMGPNGLWQRHELSGPEGTLVVTEYPDEGEPYVVEDDFVQQHGALARLIFDFNRELGRG